MTQKGEQIMICVECFKAGKRVLSVAIHLGKSVCEDCLPVSIVGGNELIADLQKIQTLFVENAKDSQDVNGRLNRMLTRMERESGEGQA